MHKIVLRGAAGIIAVPLLVAACGGNDNPVEPTPVPTCTYAVSTPGVQVPSEGGTFTVHVDAAAGCAWTARSEVSWITLSSSSGTGPADVTVTVGANVASAARNGTVTLADKPVAVQQAGRTTTPCTYALQSSSSTFGADGGKGHVTMQTDAGCAWTASSSASWLTIRTPSGSGPADIEYEVASYAGPDQRSAQILAGSASFTIRQDPPSGPCTYGVDPTSVRLHWHGAEGDGMEVRLTTLGHCTWTASSGAAWLELLTASSGTGPASMRVRVNAYTSETTRSAPLMIRWPTPTAGQNVSITQEGCRYAISDARPGIAPQVSIVDAVQAAGGPRRVSVFGDPVTVDCMVGCPWSIGNVPSWIHINGSTTHAGDDDVFYDVAPNTSGSPRSATMTIGPLTLTVNQAG
jgi:hypothetical protein